MSEPMNPGGPDKPALSCWPWSHAYTAWELCKSEWPATAAYVNTAKYQRRRCLRCGLTEQRHLGPLP